MTNKQCCEDNNCATPRILSKEATNEILGDDLSLLLAIGKNGEVVRFLPNSMEGKPAKIIESEDASNPQIEISIHSPAAQNSSAVNSLLSTTTSNQSTINSLTGCICKIGGVVFRC